MGKLGELQKNPFAYGERLICSEAYNGLII